MKKIQMLTSMVIVLAGLSTPRFALSQSEVTPKVAITIANRDQVKTESVFDKTYIDGFVHTIPAAWVSEQPRYTVDIVPKLIEVERCAYADNPFVVRQRIDVTISVFDTETKQTLGKKAYRGGTPAVCADRQRFLGGQTLITRVGFPNATEFANWFFAVMAKAGIPTPYPDARLFVDYNDGPLNMAFSPDGTQLLTAISANLDTAISIRDVKSGARAKWLDKDSQANVIDEVTGILAISYGPDATIAAVAGWEGIIVLNTTTGKRLLSIESNGQVINDITFSPDGKTILGINESVHIWDATTGDRLALLPLGGNGRRTSISFSPTGDTFTTKSSSKESLRIWDAETRETKHTISRDAVGHDYPYSSATYSADGKLLLTYSADKVILWDVLKGEPVLELTGHADDISSAGLTPDGSLIVMGEHDGTVLVWAVQTGKVIYQLTQPDGAFGVAISPDKKYLATNNMLGVVALWTLPDLPPN